MDAGTAMWPRYGFMAVFLFFLVACGKSDPVPLPQDKQQLVGVWQAKLTEFDNGVTSDNMLLIFHKNNKVSFMRCINRLNGHTYTSFPDTKLVEMNDTGFKIARDILFTDWSISFRIDRLPFEENGELYFIVNKVKLRKLKPGEKSDYTSWQCGKQKKAETDSATRF